MKFSIGNKHPTFCKKPHQSSSPFVIMTSGETVSSGFKTQSRDKAFDADRDFAPSKDFQPSTKLSTIKSAIGMLRYHLEREGKGTVTNAMAVREVANQVYAKCFHDTAFCVSVSTIQRRVEKRSVLGR